MGLFGVIFGNSNEDQIKINKEQIKINKEQIRINAEQIRINKMVDERLKAIENRGSGIF
jgi:hypothetical protein